MDRSSNLIATCFSHLRQQRPNGEKVKSDSGIDSRGESIKSDVVFRVSNACNESCCRWTMDSDTNETSAFLFKEVEQSMVKMGCICEGVNENVAPHGISNALDVLKSTAGTPLLTMHIPLSKYDSGCSKNYSGCTNPYQKLLRMYQVKTYVPEEFLCVFSPAPLVATLFRYVGAT